MPNPPPPARHYYPAPAMPSTTNTALANRDAAAGATEPAKPGLIDWMIEGFKDRGPELAANAATTKANWSEVGKAVRAAARVPLSFVVSVVASAVSAATRGQGALGEWSTRVAIGSAHATVAELSRPQPSDPQLAENGPEAGIAVQSQQPGSTP